MIRRNPTATRLADLMGADIDAWTDLYRRLSWRWGEAEATPRLTAYLEGTHPDLVKWRSLGAA